jgi:prephenate dehydratase
MLESDLLTVAIQGERGSFSEQAVRALAPTARIACFDTFEDVVAAVAEGAAEAGVLPSENSLVGPVADLTRLFAAHGLRPIGETAIPIRQCLIAARPSALSEVGEVRSHPVALRQCRRFLEAHPWMRPVATADTAGAVREVVAEGRADLAAIAGAAAADVHGAYILARDIADRADNATRFVLFERRSDR